MLVGYFGLTPHIIDFVIGQIPITSLVLNFEIYVSLSLKL